MPSQHYYISARAIYPLIYPHCRRWHIWGLLLVLLFLLPATSLPVSAQSGPPVAFGKLSPGDGSTEIASPVTLRWEPAAGATYYTFCIDTSPGNVCEAGVNNSGYTRTTATSVTLILTSGLTYYWQVSAYNDFGQTFANEYLGWHSFTVSSLPVNFSKLEPVNGTTDLPTAIKFKWDGLSSVTSSYSICIDTIANFTCDAPNGWSLVDPTNPEYTLAANTTYYWQVREQNEYGITYANGESGWHSFTTGDRIVSIPTPTPSLPGPFEQLSPQNGATDVPNPVTLRWQESTGADAYTFCITGRDACDVGFFGTGDGSVGAQTAISLTLMPGTTFWWRVRAQNENGFIAATNRWITFTTSLRPIMVNKLEPADRIGGVLTDATLRWSKVPFVTDYRICYDTTHNDSCDAGEAGWRQLGETTIHTINGLEPNTEYSWQVRPYNLHGFTEADGRWFRFRTGPGPLNKIEPINGAVNLTRTVTLKWTPAVGAVEYGFCIDKTNNNRCDLGPVLGYTRVATTRAILGNLEPNTTYYWHARAYNQFGDFTPANGPGGWFTFTTNNDGEPEYGPPISPGDSGNLGPPPTGSNGLCCMTGYVYLDGKPVISPTVTLYDGKGGALPAKIKASGLYNYFAIELRDPQLALHSGDTVTLTAEVSGTIQTQQYTLKPGRQQVDLVLPSQSGYTRPIATINQRSHIGTMDVDDVLVIHASGLDSDATPGISLYEWTLDGSIVNDRDDTLQFDANQLTSGTHTIMLRVQDEEGEWSLPLNFVIEVVEGWTLLVYFDGDSADSLDDRFGTILEGLVTMQKNGAIPQGVNVAILRDGPNDGDSHYLSYTAATTNQTSTQSALAFTATNEARMNDPATLTDFVKRGQAQFPHTHYYLAIADHGHGIAGIAWDRTSAAADEIDPDRPEADKPAYLRSSEIDEALNDPGIHNIDVLHLDACSMNMIELVYELRNSADYLISSQFLTWATFAYDDYVAAVHQELEPVDLAKLIAQKYTASVQALDPEAPYTISVLDLRYAEAATQAFTDFTSEVRRSIGHGITRPTLATVREKSQVFESENKAKNYAHEATKDFYIDVVDWTKGLMTATVQTSIQAKGQTLLNYLAESGPFIILNKVKTGTMPDLYEGHKIELENAHGLSIFYPVAQYQSILNRDSIYYLFEFARATNWSQLLSEGGILAPPGAPDLPPDPVLPLVVESSQGTGTNRLFLPLVTK